MLLMKSLINLSRRMKNFIGGWFFGLRSIPRKESLKLAQELFWPGKEEKC